MSEAESGDRPAELRPWNIGGVIPREPWEERSRDGGLETRLDGLERRLHAAVDRIEDVPYAVERRVESMEAELRRRCDELEGSLAAMERLIGADLPGRLTELAGGLATFEARVADVTTLVGELSGVLGQIRETTVSARSERLAGIRSAEVRLVAAVQGACDDLVADAADVLSEARATTAHLERLSGHLDGLDETLGVHRRELGDVLHDERQELVEVVLRTVLGTLSTKHRRRLAGQLFEEHLERPAAPARSRPQAPAPAERAEPPPVPRQHAREELLATVVEVAGIGPARARELADAFGSLGRLGVCDVEEVVAATGLAGSLAEAVIEVARSAVAER